MKTVDDYSGQGHPQYVFADGQPLYAGGYDGPDDINNLSDLFGVFAADANGSDILQHNNRKVGLVLEVEYLLDSEGEWAENLIFTGNLTENNGEQLFVITSIANSNSPTVPDILIAPCIHCDKLVRLAPPQFLGNAHYVGVSQRLEHDRNSCKK